MKIAIVDKDFGSIMISGKPKYGFRPTVGKTIRLSDKDFDQVKKDGLVTEVGARKKARTSDKMLKDSVDK